MTIFENSHEITKISLEFSNDWIDAYIELKMQEVNLNRMTTTPVEFDLYYSL